MKTIQLVTETHPLYHEVCQFADRIYQQCIKASTRDPAEYFVVATERERVCGCLGLNTHVSSDLFCNDERYQSYAKRLPPGTLVAEQNILAVEHFPAGISILIATTAALAKQLGIEHIAYAAIGVSAKTIGRLGHKVTVLGPTKASVFSAADLKKYQYWLTTHAPQSCILDTMQADQILHSTLQKFTSKATLDPTLQRILDETSAAPPVLTSA